MAELITANRNRSATKCNKLSTRVDLTPMVDLGFLLITFFIFTTSLSEPKALNFIVPVEGDSTQTAESKTLNLVLAADNKIYYYIGNEVGNQSCTDFSPSGVRNIIRQMQHTVRKKFGNADETVILIRPTASASYMNLVDILDEMFILDVKKYALMDEPAAAILSASNIKDPC